jgi:hypothetical protein
MNCPSRIAPIIVELIQTGITKAQLWGLSGDADRCTIELDHISGLPALLADYSLDKLNDYWDGARLTYLGQFDRSDATGCEDIWETLSWIVADENGLAFTVKRRRKSHHRAAAGG